MPPLSVNHSQKLTVSAKREPRPRFTVKQAGETAGRPNVKELKAALTLKSDSARNILAEITAGRAAKPTKRLGRQRP
jgi:hypothetical protein